MSLGLFAMDAGALGRVFNRPTERFQPVAEGVGAGEVTPAPGLVARVHQAGDVGRNLLCAALQLEAERVRHLAHGGGQRRRRGRVATLDPSGS